MTPDCAAFQSARWHKEEAIQLEAAARNAKTDASKYIYQVNRLYRIANDKKQRASRYNKYSLGEHELERFEAAAVRAEQKALELEELANEYILRVKWHKAKAIQLEAIAREYKKGLVDQTSLNKY